MVTPLNLIEAGLGFLPIENCRVFTEVLPGFTFSGNTPIHQRRVRHRRRCIVAVVQHNGVAGQIRTDRAGDFNGFTGVGTSVVIVKFADANGRQRCDADVMACREHRGEWSAFCARDAERGEQEERSTTWPNSLKGRDPGGFVDDCTRLYTTASAAHDRICAQVWLQGTLR